MLSLILILVLLWFVLSIVLAAWTLWFQGYIYSEPVGEIQWRAPAAGAAITLVLALWIMMDYRSPGRYLTVFDFSANEYIDYRELHVPTGNGREEVYRLQTDAKGRHQYLNRSGKGPVSRPQEIIAVDSNGEKHVFKPERDGQGKFKVSPGGSLLYHDDQGHTMTEGQFGQVVIFHFGWLVMNLLLNFLHFVAWFLVLWLLLRFQWAHAFGLAIAFWAVLTLFVVPQVLTRAEDVARQRASPKPTAALFPRSRVS